MIKDKPQTMEKRNLICLFCNQQKFNQSTLDSNISMLMMEEEEGSVMEATKIGGKRSLLNRAAKSSKSLLTSLTTMQMGTKTVMKRRMVMGTKALEEKDKKRSRRLVCLCLPVMGEKESTLKLRMVARGALVEHVKFNATPLLKGDLILAVNGTLLAGMQLNEVDAMFRGLSNPSSPSLDEADDLFGGKNAKEALSGRSKAPNLLNLILWRRSSF